VARTKHVPEGAEQTTIYLVHEDQLVLEAIRLRRRKRGEARNTPSEIISEGIWKIAQDERISRDQIDCLLRVEEAKTITVDVPVKVKQFPTRDK